MRPLVPIVLLFIGGSVLAQELFPMDSVVWRSKYEELEDDWIERCTYFYSGDTLINGLAYKKLAILTKSTPPGPEEIGYLRESDQKIYFIPSGYENPCGYWYEEPGGEYLLYDFKIKKGDTLSFGNGAMNYCYETDSVLVNDMYRKRWNFYGLNETSPILDEWIYGIGSTKGPIASPLWEFENAATLTCFEDSRVPYRYPENCEITAIKQIQNHEKIKGFPNPIAAGEIFHLGSMSTEYTQLYLYNTVGKIAHSEPLDKQTIDWIVPTSLPTGVYHLQIVDEKGLSKIQKLMIY